MTTFDTEDRTQDKTPGALRANRTARFEERAFSVWTGLPLLIILTGAAVIGLSDYSLYTFNLCLLSAMGAVALNLQMGTTGQVSLGNSAFLLLGAFTAAGALRRGIDFPGDLVVAILASAFVGLIIGIPALRLKGLYFALATVSAYFIIYFLCSEYQRRTVGEAGFAMPTEMLRADVTRDTAIRWAWMLAVILGAVVVLCSVLSKGRSGRALRMIRDHENAAPTFGISVLRSKLLVFGVGFGIIGMQGALAGHYAQFATLSSYTLLLTVQYVAMVVIGGPDSIAGTIVGAFFVTWLPVLTTNSLAGVLGPEAVTKGPQIALILYGLLVIFVVTRMPDGVAGALRSGYRLVRRRLG